MKRQQKWSFGDIVKLCVQRAPGEDWKKLEIKKEEEKERFNRDDIVALAPIMCAVLVMLLLMWLSY